MAITQAEVADSGISSDDFNAIANGVGGFIRQLIVQKYNPSFSLHDQITRSGVTFSAAADDTKIIRTYNYNGNVYAEYLLVESDNPASLNSWVDMGIISAALFGLQPKIVKQASGWDIIFVQTNGKFGRAHSAAGTGSWSISDFGSFAIPTDGTVTHASYGGGSIEICYWLQKTTINTYQLKGCDTSGNAYDPDIYWFSQPSGMDVEELNGVSEDSTNTIDPTRHILSICAETPGYFTYNNSSGVPVQILIHSGGIVSFVVNPPITGNHPLMLSQVQPIKVFDETNILNYRATTHLSPMNSIFNVSSPRDILWSASAGSNGDSNTTDVSVGFNAIFLSSSRDGKRWSQEQIVPIDGLPDFSNFSSGNAGVQVVKCGHYAYILSTNVTLRSLLTAIFGPTVHPDNQMDITSYTVEYSVSAGDQRQSNIILDNRNGKFNTGLLGSPGTLVLIHKIGKHLSGTDYLFQTAIEEIDTIAPYRNHPQEQLQITSRDRMSWMTDKTQSEDAVTYDGNLAGLDNFKSVSATVDSGLAHTAAIEGTFTTALAPQTLSLTSRYQEGIALNTFSTNIADGAIESTFILPNPTVFDLVTSPINSTTAPTYSGVVFRAFDKSNFSWVKYDYYQQKILVGYRNSGTDIIINSYNPSTYFKSQANGTLPATIRIEFRHSFLKIYTKENDGKLHLLASLPLPGIGSRYTPVMQGSVGVIGCGYSDQDQSPSEPAPAPPIAVDFGELPNLHRGSKNIATAENSGSGFWCIISTNDFDTPASGGGPTWTMRHIIAEFGYQFVVDAFSPGYIGTGTSIDGWGFTRTGLYKYSDCFGSTSRTLQHGWRATPLGIAADFSFTLPGRGVCFVNYADGIYETHTNDGGASWSTEKRLYALVDGTHNYDFTVASGAPLVTTVTWNIYLPGYPTLGTWTSGQGWVGQLVGGSGDSGVRIQFKVPGHPHFTYATTIYFHGEAIGLSGMAGDAYGYYDVIDDSGTNSAVYLTPGEIVFSTSGVSKLFTTAIAGNSPTNVPVRIEGMDLTVYLGPMDGSPGAYRSSHNPNTTLGATYDRGQISGNAGGTYSSYLPIVVDDSLPGIIFVPYQNNTDDSVVYYGKTHAGVLSLWRVQSGVATDISPATGYGPDYSTPHFTVYADPTNRLSMVAVLRNLQNGNFAIYTSSNGGSTWTAVQGPSGIPWRMAALSGDGLGAMYVWGDGSSIGYSIDGGVTIDSRQGNYNSISNSSSIKTIFGGVA